MLISQQIVARVFGQSTPGERALWTAGVVSCALALIVLALALRAAPSSPDARSLFIAGIALFSGGVGACVLGWRPRRQWVRLDDINLSRPWAAGKASLPLRALSGIQVSAAGGVLVSATSGEQLRIDSEIREFQELLEQLCDRITENGYPATGTVWKDGRRQVSFNGRELSLRDGTAEPGRRLGWGEIMSVHVARDARRRLVPALRLRQGRELLLPYLGKAETLEIYRVLRQALRSARPESLLPAAAPAQSAG
jgi:hypothetical protein